MTIAEKNTHPAAERSTQKREPTSARERILETAANLFYSKGIRSIGIDTIIAESGVAKASLYRNFESKDALIEAFAEARDASYWSWWDGVEDRHRDDPDGFFDALFAGVAQQIRQPGFRGCPFIKIATEFPDPRHPGTSVACANKQKLRDRLRAVCEAIGTVDPERASLQLLMLINGAYSTGAMMPDIDLTEHLRDAARRIVQADTSRQGG